MYALSAAEAISPAINRTKTLLFRPFRWGVFLKLCLVAVITEGFSSNFNSNRGGGAHVNPSFTAFAMEPGWIAACIAMGLLIVLVCIALFYLIVRLRFALFNCLLHQSTEIKPGWRLYREKANRFFVFNIVVGVIYLIVAGIAVFPFAIKLFHIYQQSKVTGQMNFPEMFTLLLPFLPVAVALILLAFAVDMVMRDFMLPHVALDGASVTEAWYAVIGKIAEEKGAFLLYAVLRILLPLAAMVGLFIVLIIPCLLVFGTMGVAIAGIHAAVADAGPAAVAIGTVVEALLGLIIFALGLLLAIGVGGPLCIAIRNYALVFYGGRFKALGDILFPLPPPSSVTVGVSPA